MTHASTSTACAARELLGRGNPREILTRIVPGDPLGIRPRAARRVRERALLFEVESVALRALALTAARGPDYRGRPGLEPWLDARVDEALDELLSEEQAGAPRALSAARPIAEGLGLRPEAVAGGRARFHALAREDRDAFHRLVLEARPLEEIARELGLGAEVVARRARRGLLAFVAAEVRP